MGRTLTKDDLKKSDQWERSIGKAPGIHFRNGKKHAVVKPGSKIAEIHHDKHAAHDEPVKHMMNDAPMVSAGIGLLGLAALSKMKN